VLASDVAHYYANMEQGRPFPFLTNVLDSLEAYARLRELASAENLIIPGHDPLVLRRFPLAVPGVDGIVRLDAEPLHSA
jgi:glyoxylase-like metal-dependent hydrolase (beta-lactamase superfamily II)